MQRIPVDSTDVVSVGYDAKTRVLEIEFGGSRIYQYTDVPPDVHERFMRADSFGTFFNTFISGHYRYDRINEEKQAVSEAVAFITGNARKYRDFGLACKEFNIKTEQLKLPVDEIQGHDAETIAVHKAKEAYRLAGRPVVVNDVYWNILALRGFPGAYMSYMVGWLKTEDWLALMQGKQDRTIGCTDTLVYYDGKGHVLAVSVALRGSALELGTPVKLFDANFLNGYFAMSRDGQRFYANMMPVTTERTVEAVPLTVILNWSAGLKR